ncbi:hypothetical protein [Demequina muriae]|uniref:Cytochrome oxidase subunit II transmembrane region profile domain-containing protein n=1 Tax=Demequina muriae TaxID=3051664 RepID=A0ABT8GE31_9MICO|nr:hypothetical protein [Demequina sp. EGI L300058]MDN4479680.1 hypothetical protein [Demequina sp. EGI L300058]
MANPLVPAVYDVIWTLAVLAIPTAIVVTIVLVVRRSRAHGEGSGALQANTDVTGPRDTPLA